MVHMVYIRNINYGNSQEAFYRHKKDSVASSHGLAAPLTRKPSHEVAPTTLAPFFFCDGEL